MADDRTAWPEYILAVFETREQALMAADRLTQSADQPRLEVAPLRPGTYPLADINRGLERRRAIRGTLGGAIVGATVGLGVSAMTGFGLFPAIGWAAAGALGGLIAGVLRSMGRVEWDDEGHAVVNVPNGRTYILVIVKLADANDQRARERIIRTLARSGALVFIEPSAYLAELTGVAPQ